MKKPADRDMDFRHSCAGPGRIAGINPAPNSPRRARACTRLTYGADSAMFTRAGGAHARATSNFHVTAQRSVTAIGLAPARARVIVAADEPG